MGNKNTQNRQPVIVYPPATCQECEEIIREDERLKTKREISVLVRDAILEGLGDHEKNSIQIMRLWRTSYVILGILCIFGYLIAHLYSQ